MLAFSFSLLDNFLWLSELAWYTFHRQKVPVILLLLLCGQVYFSILGLTFLVALESWRTLQAEPCFSCRNFAKRQLTWFRNEPLYHWIDASRPMVYYFSYKQLAFWASIPWRISIYILVRWDLIGMLLQGSVLDFIYDSYHSQFGHLEVPKSLSVKKEISSRREVAEMKAYRPRNQYALEMIKYLFYFITFTFSFHIMKTKSCSKHLKALHWAWWLHPCSKLDSEHLWARNCIYFLNCSQGPPLDVRVQNINCSLAHEGLLHIESFTHYPYVQHNLSLQNIYACSDLRQQWKTDIREWILGADRMDCQ